MKFSTVVSLPFLGFAVLSAAHAVSLESPDHLLVVQVDRDGSGHLNISAAYKKSPVLSPSLIGVSVDKQDLGAGVTIGEPKTSAINEDYPTLGVHPIAHNHGNESEIAITSGTAKIGWQLDVRVYNDGFAYRFHVPETGTHHVDGESSSWSLPQDAKIWYQNDLGSYEGQYTETTVGALAPGTILAFPTTLQLSPSGPFLTVTEANLVQYSDMAVKADGNHVLHAFFHSDAMGWNLDGDLTSPWRTTIVASDLNALVNSDMVHNLCPAPSPDLANATWIVPGRCSWQWWSSGGPKIEEQHQWIDWTKQLGFEYYLIDEGWGSWKAEGKDKWQLLKETVDYAKTQNVKILVWLRYSDVPDQTKRLDFFQHAKDCGVSGLKIDFPPGPSLKIVNWYDETLADAVKFQFPIDFHGATKPTGRDRTWPNEINREGIRGHEYQITRYHRTQLPNHDTILPFTRYISGHADYTPTAFNPHETRGFTWTRELAQAIVFTSPLLCYADSPKFYLENPSLEVLKAIPSTWDETVVLPGSEIGKIVGFARRKGDSWFIGVMNAGNPKTLDLELSFLGPKKYKFVKLEDVPGKDAALNRTETTATSADKVHLELGPSGGFVGWLTRQ